MNPQQIRRVARDLLGYERLRPGQERAMRAVLDGRDTLAVMPTGSGKSAIYQVAAAQIPGPTLVVSPLIALQRDQVDAIVEQEAGGAAQVNTTIPPAERRQALDDLRGGEVEFLFLAPEQLANPEVLAELEASRPSLFVVDEAHCVSDWGHDFRPQYLRLSAAIEALGHPTVVALTATASPPVREEIIGRLGMRDPAIVIQGFDRPNIFLAVERCDDVSAKLRALTESVLAAPQPGIVYVATRRRAEDVAAALGQAGLRVRAYHAGMRASERGATHEAFMGGELDVIVATTAFGMGIDKSDVRFVYHYDISESLDAYYQEIGRAGRDDEPAEARLFYRPEDLAIRRFFSGGGQLDPEVVQRVGSSVLAAGAPLPLTELAAEIGLGPNRLLLLLQRLEDAGVVKLGSAGDVAPAGSPADLATAVDAAVQAADRRRRIEQSRVEMMRGYAEGRSCRRAYLLGYFGEPFEPPCGHCDSCVAGRTAAASEHGDLSPVGARVRHARWGAGQVMRYEGETVIVLFDEVGYKTLDVALVAERRLLEPA